jgi:hypothetical protein
MGFQSVEEVQRFVDEHGEAALMADVRSPGRHGEASMKYFIEWQAAQEVKWRDDDRALMLRAVQAAENSAAASGRSATAAKWAAIATAIAGVLAVVGAVGGSIAGVLLKP